MKRILTTWLAAAAMLTAEGQTARTVVVADATTREPIAHASLYTKEEGQFRSCVSDAQGRATIRFDFRRLTVSHLNYETSIVRRLSDTLWLKPRFRSTAEVVVTNKEPEWIRRKLRQVVKQKESRYFSLSDTLRFSYHTQSMGTNSLYRYHMTGLMSMKSDGQKRYAVAPDSSLIVGADSTQLTDVANLQRMLYEDFVAELDGGFITGHRWGENPDFKGRSADEVELFFRSKHRTDDRGRVVIDTARCVILEATRRSGTETNRHERISAMLYGMARLMSGYNITQWLRDYRVTYAERPDGTLYPASVAYKMYFANTDGEVTRDQQEFHEQTGGGFPNMEATLELAPPTAPLSLPTWHELYPSWYLRLSSEEARQRDVRLSHLPATFQIYEEDEH